MEFSSDRSKQHTHNGLSHLSLIACYRLTLSTCVPFSDVCSKSACCCYLVTTGKLGTISSTHSFGTHVHAETQDTQSSTSCSCIVWTCWLYAERYRILDKHSNDLLVGMPRTLETAAWVSAVHWVELTRETPSSSGIQREVWVSM